MTRISKKGISYLLNRSLVFESWFWFGLESVDLEGVVVKLVLVAIFIGNTEYVLITWLFFWGLMWKQRLSINKPFKFAIWYFTKAIIFVFPRRNRNTPYIRQLILTFLLRLSIFFITLQIQLQILPYLRNISQSLSFPNPIVLQFLKFRPRIIKWLLFLFFDLGRWHFLDFIFVYKCLQDIFYVKFLLEGFGASSSQLADVAET